jgi:hypothetical protein
MAETTLQQHLEKAYTLAYRAQRLTRVDRTAMRIYKELKEIIENLEFYLHNKIEYDEAEVGTKLRYYEKQLQLIEEKRDPSLRQMVSKFDCKLGSLPQDLG